MQYLEVSNLNDLMSFFKSIKNKQNNLKKNFQDAIFAYNNWDIFIKNYL